MKLNRQIVSGSVWMKQAFLFLMYFGLAAAGSGSGHAVGTSDLNYFKLVQMPGFEDNQPMYISLDQEIYKYCRPDFGDVRIFDESGAEVPRWIYRRPESRDRYPVFDFSVAIQPDGRVLIDVKTNGEPLVAFNLGSTAQNFHYDVSIEEMNASGNRSIGKGEIYNRNTDSGNESVMSIPVEESRAKEFRLEMIPVTGGPVSIDSVHIEVPVHHMVYQARKGASYQLFWGAEDMSPPEYDTSILQDIVARDQPMKRARAGRGFVNPDFGIQSAQDGVSGGGSWYYLPAALLLVIAVVFLITRAGKPAGS